MHKNFRKNRKTVRQILNHHFDRFGKCDRIKTLASHLKMSTLFFEKKDEEKGTKYISEYLSDCKIKSPDISKVKFADNVTDAIAVDGSERIMGTVNSIEEITASDDDKEEYLESVDTSSD